MEIEHSENKENESGNSGLILGEPDNLFSNNNQAKQRGPFGQGVLRPRVQQKREPLLMKIEKKSCYSNLKFELEPHLKARNFHDLAKPPRALGQLKLTRVKSTMPKSGMVKTFQNIDVESFKFLKPPQPMVTR